jgi:ABC-type nitrate/sulfonate/bicarbonate transport system substrate-binding protein
MTNVPVKIGCMKYDRTRALFDGEVKIPGADAVFEDARLASDVFERMVRDQAYDIAELGLTFYLRTLDLADPPFVALPVFPARQFRHAAIFVNTQSGISKPEDLAGKTIGEFGTYGHDVGVVAKGILADDYGVTPDQCRWLVGGADEPMAPFDFVPFRHPADVDVTPDGRALGPMLAAGEIDALISARVPQCVVDGEPTVARLFPDYETVERDYFARTGSHPIMHTLVVRKAFLAEHPDVVRAVVQAFGEAKDAALTQYRRGALGQHVDLMIPWFTPLFERDDAMLRGDWWPYGVEKNRDTLDTFLRYFFEQGLGDRPRTCDELFAPEFT